MARRTTWRDTLINNSITSSGATVVEYNAGATQDENRGSTLTRTIVELALWSTSVAAAWGVQMVDIGLGLIEADALAAGAVPDPADDRDEPARGWIH